MTRRSYLPTLFLLLATIGLKAENLYAVLGAYKPEMQALHEVLEVDEARGWTQTEINGIAFWQGEVAGKRVLLFSTGVSTVNAA